MKIEHRSWIDDAWDQPLPDLDSPTTLVLAFGAPGRAAPSPPLNDLVAAYPQSAVVGCSTAGEIHGTTIRDDSVSVAVVRFDKTRVRTASASVAGAQDSQLAGKQIAAELEASDLAAMLVLSEGLHVNGTELVAGINDVVDPSVVVTGGLAGDGDRFDETWVLADGTTESHRIVAVGLYGDQVEVGHGSKGGWDIFGPERIVTRSQGNVLYELDGQPALQLYRDYLGELADGLPATGLLFPLAIREPGDDERALVRTILGIDEATNSLTFAGDIPQGHHAQLMQANFDRLVGGAEEAALHATDADAEDLLVVAISCVGRRLVLGERAEEEIEATMDVLPVGAVQVGFYSYGELSPHANGRCDLHNQTMTLTTIAEV